MSKATKIAKTLDEVLGEKKQDVRVVMPKQFLANLSKAITDQNNEIAKLVESKDKSKYFEQLVKDNHELKQLMVNLENAVRESRVDKVEVGNFPKPKEVVIPKYPDKVSIRKPLWWKEFSDNKIIDTLEKGLTWIGKRLNLDKYQKAENALAVRLVDKNGKDFYTAWMQAISSSGGGGGAATTGNVNIFDGGGTALTSTFVGADQALDVNVVQTVGGGAGGTASTDDADFTAGTTPGTPAMGVYESSPTSVTDGDMGIVGITEDRKLRVDGSEVTQPISAASLPLPSGAATAANQQTDALTDTELRASAIEVDLGTNNDVTLATLPDTAAGDLAALVAGQLADGHNVTVDNASLAVTAASLPLPTGASTSAKQDTIIGHVDGIEGLLGTIDTDTGNIATSVATIAGDTTSLDGKDFATETTLASILAGQLPDGHNVTIDNASIAVTGTFWQATQPISAASLPLPSGAATAANQQTDALTDTELRATPVPVSGTVTANLSATDNAVLDDIAANQTDKSQHTKITDGTEEANVNASNELQVRDDDANTDLDTIAGAVSGSEMQVDVVGSLPAGTNAIGKLAANSGVDIGDVDVTSLPAAAPDTNHFHATITSADATSATTVKAKTAAKKIHVTSLEISVGSTAMEVQLQSDNGTPQVVMEEQFFAANTGLTWTAADKTLPLFIINTNEDLDVIASAAGDVTVSVAGYVS